MSEKPRILTADQVGELCGEVIKDISSVRGRPGGANNDHITIEFESGKTLDLSIFAIYESVAQVSGGEG